MTTADHTQRSERTQDTYRDFLMRTRKAAHDMGKALGLSSDIVDKACNLYQDLMDCHPPSRSPHGLMVDCLYIIANEHGAHCTTRQFQTELRDRFGVGTEPRPFAWADRYGDILACYRGKEGGL